MTTRRGLRVLSLNVRKQPENLLSLLNSTHPSQFDLMCIQEVPITFFNRPSLQSPHWRLILPTQANPKSPPRSLIYINSFIPSDSYQVLSAPTLDLTAITLTLPSPSPPITIISLYNAPRTTKAISDANVLLHSIDKNSNILLLGDFNLHHPMWSGDSVPHRTRACDASTLLDLISAHHLTLALPPATPTFFSSSRHSWSTIDLAFISQSLSESVLWCKTESGHGSDHRAVSVGMDLTPHQQQRQPRRKWKETDWVKFQRRTNELLEQVEAQKQAGALNTTQAVDTLIRDLNLALIQAANDAVPIAKPSPHQKRWWTPQLKGMQRHLRTLQHRQQRHPNDTALNLEVNRARNQYHNAIRRSKRQHWLKYLSEITSQTIWDAARYTQESSNSRSTRLPDLQSAAGLARTNEEKCYTLCNTFFPPPPPADLSDTNNTVSPPPVPSNHISKEEIELAIDAASPHKAPGPNGIPTAAIQHLRPILTPILHPLFNALLRLQYHPTEWRSSTTVVLRKPGKPDYSLPKAYRPIALQDTLSKIMESVIARRLSTWAEQYGLLPATHFGGRPGRTTTDAVLTLTHFVKDAWRRGEVVSSLFLDISQAFPSVSHPRLLFNLRKRRVPVSIIAWLGSFLSQRTTCISFDDYLSPPLPASVGIPQGSPLSPILYLFYSADLLEIFGPIHSRNKKEIALGFIDDTSLAVRGPSIRHNINVMTRVAPRLEQWSDTHACRFDVPKFQLIHLTRNKQRYEPLPLTIGRHTIHPTDSAKYLGIHIDRQLRWYNHLEATIAKGTNTILAISRLTGPAIGMPLQYARQLYQSLVLPKITYGLVVWYEPTRSSTPDPVESAEEEEVLALHKFRRRQKGSVGMERRLSKIQNMASRLITGGFRSTPVALLDYHAGLPPFHLTLHRLAFLATSRLSALPCDHPLYLTVKRAARYYPRFHHTAAHELFHTFPQLRTVETIDATPFPSSLKPGAVNIAANREEALALVASLTADLYVYTDGSIKNDRAGAAAVCRDSPRTTQVRHIYLGHGADRSETDTELAGIFAALDIIQRTRCRGSVIILSDSQQAIRLLDNPRPLSGQHLVRLIHNKARHLQMQRPNIDIRLMWIPSHCNNPGNDWAHKEARRSATQHLTSPSLTGFQFDRNPASLSALRRDFQKDFKEQWQGSWDAAPSGDRIRLISNTPVGPKATRQFAGLSRPAASLIIQLRTRHIALNSFLHRIRRADSPLCTRCQEPETVTHFLFHCRRYLTDRLTLLTSLKHHRLDSKLVLGNPDNFSLLASYLTRTNRFPQYLTQNAT